MYKKNEKIKRKELKTKKHSKINLKILFPIKTKFSKIEKLNDKIFCSNIPYIKNK
jgi:hypothetical protein